MIQRRGLALRNAIIVMAVLAGPAGIMVSQLCAMADLVRPAAMAGGVRQIRQAIEYHAAVGDAPLSVGGYPATIDPAWFRDGRLPGHTWTDGPLIVEVIEGSPDQVYPPKKTFEAAGGAGRQSGPEPNAWYNVTNGAFCVLVPRQGREARILKRFNLANHADAVRLDQTK